MKTALIIGGGEMDPLLLASIHDPADIVLCADRGAETAWEADITPDVIIGDMDSISSGTLNHFFRAGVRVVTDSSPDHLDTELAVIEAVKLGVGRIVILGSWGDRIDQSLASFSFLDPANIPISRREKDGITFQGDIIVVTPGSIIRSVPSGSSHSLKRGTKIALLPLPQATGVTTRGLQFELKDVDLTFSGCWSVSNSVAGDPIEVQYREGNLALMTMFLRGADMVGELRRIMGRAGIPDTERDYHRVLREIYDHRGKAPPTGEEKEARLTLTRKLLDRVCPGLGSISIVHIAGTSGKGSVALYLQSILSRRFPTGLVISPHLHDLNERIQVNGKPIPHSEVVRIWDELQGEVRRFEEETGEIVLFHEIILLIAFTYFRNRNIDWAIVETGLGGRYDQTRVLDPKVTVITQIDLDHTHILGTTVLEIAHEKAGIIRPGIPLYTAEQNDQVLELFRKRCQGSGSLFQHCLPVRWSPADGMGMTFVHGETGYSIHQAGEHQAVNANLAVSIAEEIPGVREEDLREGLDQTHLPGRIEVRGRLIIDTAHNALELRMLHRTLTACLPKGIGRVVVCGMADTKDHEAMLREVGKLADILILTRAGYRGEDPMRLLQMTRKLDEFNGVRGVLVEPDPLKAYRLGRRIAYGVVEGHGEGGEHMEGEERRSNGTVDRCLIVTGSTFLVDEIFNPDEELRRINSGQ